MRILVAGGTGLVGSKIIEQALKKGWDVNVLSRGSLNPFGDKVDLYQWNTSEYVIDEACIEGVDAIINLAGYSVSNRWSEKSMKLMVDSRVNSTRTLVKLANRQTRPLVFINASAIGYYPDSDELMAEDGPKGRGFMADLVADWENETSNLNENIRLAVLRIGVVLAREGGAYQKVRMPFSLGFGSVPGSGKEWVSWVHIDDLVNMFFHTLEDSSVSGIYNAVASDAYEAKAFYRTLAKSFNRPLWLPNAPKWALKLVMGKGIDEILASHKVSNKRMIETGFNYSFDDLDAAFSSLR